MSFDDRLAERVREALVGHRPVEEKPMFGGLAFLVRGNMACAVVGDDLVVRMDPDDLAEALERPGSRRVDASGRPLNGMLFIGREGTRSRPRLARWIKDAVAFAATIPVRRS
jgi:TfoX/Sxy family transcriptional regulator of competence genes